MEPCHDSLVGVYNRFYPSVSSSVQLQPASFGILKSRQLCLSLKERSLFAIAYATDLCYGNNPAAYRYVENQCNVGNVFIAVGRSEPTENHTLVLLYCYLVATQPSLTASWSCLYLCAYHVQTLYCFAGTTKLNWRHNSSNVWKQENWSHSHPKWYRQEGLLEERLWACTAHVGCQMIERNRWLCAASVGSGITNPVNGFQTSIGHEYGVL